MKLITVGDRSEIRWYIDRFLELNQYDDELDETESERMFYEVIHLAYAIKVLIRLVLAIFILLTCSFPSVRFIIMLTYNFHLQ